MKIFLCGHGMHDLKNGYVDLPRRTTVSFYTSYFRLMDQSDVLKIVSGEWTREPVRVVTEFKKCPNMTLLEERVGLNGKTVADFLEETRAALSRNPEQYQCKCLNVNELSVPSLTLEEIFRRWPGNDFVWTCCSEVGLKKKTGDRRDYQSAIEGAYKLNKGESIDKVGQFNPGVLDAYRRGGRRNI